MPGTLYRPAAPLDVVNNSIASPQKRKNVLFKIEMINQKTQKKCPAWILNTRQRQQDDFIERRSAYDCSWHRDYIPLTISPPKASRSQEFIDDITNMNIPLVWCSS